MIKHDNRRVDRGSGRVPDSSIIPAKYSGRSIQDVEVAERYDQRESPAKFPGADAPVSKVQFGTG